MAVLSKCQLCTVFTKDESLHYIAIVKNNFVVFDIYIYICTLQITDLKKRIYDHVHSWGEKYRIQISCQNSKSRG